MIDVTNLSDRALLARLNRLRIRMEVNAAKGRDLDEERAALWREGRRRNPPITQQALADASGVSDVYVARATK